MKVISEFTRNSAIANQLAKAATRQNVLGTIYYVDPVGGDDTQSGLLWSTALETITEALTLAVDGDAIMVGPGDINEDGLVLDIKNLKLIGTGYSPSAQGGGPLFIGTAATILTVTADNVEIAGFGFAQTFAANAITVAPDTDTAARWRVFIHDCFFDGYNTALFGIWEGDTWDCPYIVVQNCDFQNFAGPCIRQRATHGLTIGNRFYIGTAMTGIVHVPNGADRPGSKILNNEFITIDNVNGVGIEVSNTPDPGQLMIDGNHFVNFATDTAACDVVGSGKAGLMGLNYHGITAMAIV